MGVLTVAKWDSVLSRLRVKRRATLVIMVLASLCGTALAADTEWTHLARRIIVKWDGLERQAKAFCGQKPPANMSQECARAWKTMMWKADTVRRLCSDIIKCAKRVERGNESDQIIEKLGKLIHEFNLAWNEFEEALEAWKSVRLEES